MDVEYKQKMNTGFFKYVIIGALAMGLASFFISGFGKVETEVNRQQRNLQI